MPTDTGRTAIDVTVEGIVQGVGYRWTVMRAAEDLGVTGWVANEADGSVSAHLEGPARAVESVLEVMRRGSRFSTVHRVATRPGSPEGFAGFSTR